MTEPEATIRAGWTSYIRVHGVVRVSAEVRAFVWKMARNSVRHIDGVNLQIEREIVLPINHSSANWYAIMGDESPQPRTAKVLRDDDPVGCWIQLLVHRQYSIERAVAEQFIARSGDGVRQLDSILGAQIDSDLREIGILGSGLLAAMLVHSQPSLRACGHAFWWDDTGYAVSVPTKVKLTVLPRVHLSDGALSDLLRQTVMSLTAAEARGDKVRRALVLAAEWLLTVTDLPTGSNERFVVYFQVIEALSRCVRVDPAPPIAKSLEALRRLVGEYAGTDSDKLLGFLNSVRERMLSPPLRVRFAALARSLDVMTAEAAIQSFDAMNRLRNELVHARIDVLPQVWEGFDVEQTMRQLATTYFLLLSKPP